MDAIVAGSRVAGRSALGLSWKVDRLAAPVALSALDRCELQGGIETEVLECESPRVRRHATEPAFEHLQGHRRGALGHPRHGQHRQSAIPPGAPGGRGRPGRPSRQRDGNRARGICPQPRCRRRCRRLRRRRRLARCRRGIRLPAQLTPRPMDPTPPSRAGKAVLCEKPLCVGSVQTQAVLDTAISRFVAVGGIRLPVPSPAPPTCRPVGGGGRRSGARAEQRVLFQRVSPRGDRLSGLGGGALADVGCYPIALAQEVLSTRELSAGDAVGFSTATAWSRPRPSRSSSLRQPAARARLRVRARL